MDDLEQIVRYIGRDSPEYASRVAAAIVEAIERTATFPRIGREIPELQDEAIREVLPYRYRIIYGVASLADKPASPSAARPAALPPHRSTGYPAVSVRRRQCEEEA